MHCSVCIVAVSPISQKGWAGYLLFLGKFEGASLTPKTHKTLTTLSFSNYLGFVSSNSPGAIEEIISNIIQPEDSSLYPATGVSLRILHD